MKAFKYRFYPTEEQTELLTNSFGCSRFVWNHILHWRSKEYSENNNSINSTKASSKLTTIKQEFTFLQSVSAVALQQSLINQDTAFKNFYSKRSSYPKFKRRDSNQSIRLVNTAFRYKNGQLFIAKSKEPLLIKWDRKLKGIPSSITISKNRAGQYHVSILTNDIPDKLPSIDKTIGLDWGLTDFITTSDGDKYKPLSTTKKYQESLAIKQRKMAKKKLGSNNRNKARIRVAKQHLKISNTRKDYLHKLSTKLINENQVISIETLDINGMMKNKFLAKSIADSGWNMFSVMLKYKAEWYGRELNQVPQYYPSSQICNICGTRSGKKPLDIRVWRCNSCNSVLDRDINAARNIDTVGRMV